MKELKEKKAQEEKKEKSKITKEKDNTMRDLKQDEINSTIEARLMESINVDSLIQCDTDMAEVFIKTFYSLSRDNTKIQSGNPGIVTSFLRNWTSTRSVGNLPKVLPTILTGMFVNLKVLLYATKSTVEKNSRVLSLYVKVFRCSTVTLCGFPTSI